jgi:hypothetical protein
VARVGDGASDAAFLGMATRNSEISAISPDEPKPGPSEPVKVPNDDPGREPDPKAPPQEVPQRRDPPPREPARRDPPTEPPDVHDPQPHRIDDPPSPGAPPEIIA